MFKQSGNFKGKVLETMLAEPKFSKDPMAFDLCLKVQGPDAPDGSTQIDWWRGEMSSKVATKGSVQGMTQAAITLQQLQKVGFQGNDINQLDAQLVGKEIEFFVDEREYEQKKFYDVKYLGGLDSAPSKLDPNEIARRMAALTGQASAAAPATAAPAQTAPAAAPAMPAAPAPAQPAQPAQPSQAAGW